MASSSMFLGLLLLLTPTLLGAKEFHVGGKDGWVANPSEDYNQWARTHRFRVNDTLHFKYVKGNDSVLVVKKEDYDSCNTNNPKQKLDGGDSKFKLSDSGYYYFISGNVDNCKHGEKVIVLVMAVSHTPHGPAVPPSQPPASASPPKIPLAYVDTPAPSPSKATSVGVVVWVVLMLFGGYAGFVY